MCYININPSEMERLPHPQFRDHRTEQTFLFPLASREFVLVMSNNYTAWFNNIFSIFWPTTY